MLKVLLVDDELRILNHLKLSISWESLGLSIIGCASNGQEALSFLKKENIDILITDIRMPVMDGLELCQHVRKTNTDIQIILLTGYSDFEYARRAIELQVTDYCLKPIDTAALSEILHRCVRKSYNPTHADALLDLIEAGNPDEIKQAFHNLGIRSNRVYLAGSIGVHNIEKRLHANLSFKVGKHKYLYFSSTPFDENAALKVIAYANGRCGIGLPSSPFSFEDLTHAIDDVLVMTFQYFINGTPTLCSHLIPEDMSAKLFEEFEENKNCPEQLKPWLQKLAGSNCSMLFNIRTAFRLFNRIAMCPALQNNNDNESYLYGFEQMASEYLHFSDLLNKLSASIHTQAKPETASFGSGSFFAILTYLNTHYSEDISLKKISEEFHLNSSYVSQLIKSETGLTYTQYVTELRIGKARELLKTTDMSLSEISEAVGFNDYFYFIKKFKKETGVTPGKYADS